MEKIDYDYKMQSGVTVGVNGEMFEQSFGNREQTEDMLDLIKISNDRLRTVIGINGTAHSNKVIALNATNLNERAKLAAKGIDGIIITNLDQTKDKISLILGVADCGPLCVSDKNGTMLGVVHAGYAGTAKDIVGNLIDTIDRAKIDKKDLEFYIGPMAGDKFEFGKEHYAKTFFNLFMGGDYDLDPSNYYIDTGRNTGYLDLRSLIFDILIANGIEENQIQFETIESNNPNNPWPSYRLYSKATKIMKSFKELGFYLDEYSSLETKKQAIKMLRENQEVSEIEEELILSEHFTKFLKDKRIGVFVEN